MSDGEFSIALNANGPEPLYLQVGHHISGLLGHDPRFIERLPSEAELCKLYAVSRITVRQALAYLADRDIVVRQHGRGTFVGTLHKPGRQSSINSFFDILTDKGIRPEREILDYRMCDPPHDVISAFSSDEKVMFVRRGYREGSRPLGVTEVFYPGSLADRITADVAAGQSSVRILQDVLGLKVTHADISIGLATASVDVAHWLELSEQTPLMKITRVTNCAEIGVCEYSRLLVSEGTAEFRIDAKGSLRSELI